MKILNEILELCVTLSMFYQSKQKVHVLILTYVCPITLQYSTLCLTGISCYINPLLRGLADVNVSILGIQ